MTGFSPWLAANKQFLILWIGAACTLGLYSILYRENKVYRFFEHLYLGLATGYLVSQTWNNILLKRWWVPLWDEGKWWMIWTLVAGAFFYFIYIRQIAWLARLMIGFFLGMASGQAFQGFVNDVWPQIPNSFKPVIPHAAVTNPATGAVIAPAITWPDAINNLIFMFILFTVMSYFFFSFELKNPVIRASAQWGRWLLMFAFGAIFGSTIMARLALLIDRTDYLIAEVGGTMGPSGPTIMNVVLILLGILIIVLALRPGAKEEEVAEERQG